MSATVTVTDSTVTVSNLALNNPEVVQYFEKLPEEERPEAAVRAIEIGVFCLQRAQLGQGLDFVRFEVQKLIQSAEKELSKIPELVEQKVGGDKGPLAPVRIAVTSAQNAIHQKLNEVSGLFSQHLDPASAQATLGQALSTIRDLINPERTDSVQKRIDAAIASIAQPDGTVAATVRREVESATSSLREAVNALTIAYSGKKGAEEALAETTEKGVWFENNEVLPMVRNWSANMGGEFTHVGPASKEGDFVIRLHEKSAGPSGLSMVLESKDLEQGWGRIRISEYMNTALRNWDGNYGIYVSKTHVGLAKEIGEYCELTCEMGPIIACTFEQLPLALRFAAVDFKFRELQRSQRAINVSSIEGNLDRFRTTLNHLTQIKSKITAIRGPLDQIETEANEMRSEINSALVDIEAALPKG